MSPRPDVSAERRRQILQAAQTCFMRSGYNKTTMDEIAAASGLSKGSLYWYFEGKDDLLQAVFLDFFEKELGYEQVAALEQLPTAAAKLQTILQMMVGLGEKVQGLFNLFLEYWASSTRREDAANLWTSMLVQYKNVLVGIIEEGIRNGEFRPVDAEGLVWAMMAAYDGLTVYLSLVPDLDIQRAGQTLAETLLDGLLVGKE